MMEVCERLCMATTIMWIPAFSAVLWEQLSEACVCCTHWCVSCVAKGLAWWLGTFQRMCLCVAVNSLINLLLLNHGAPVSFRSCCPNHGDDKHTSARLWHSELHYREHIRLTPKPQLWISPAPCWFIASVLYFLCSVLEETNNFKFDHFFLIHASIYI